MSGRNILELLLDAVEGNDEQSLLELMQGGPGMVQINLSGVNQFTPLTDEQFQLLTLATPSQMLH